MNISVESPQVRGSAGEHSEAAGGLYDISNRERMGLTEFQAIFHLIGCSVLWKKIFLSPILRL